MILGYLVKGYVAWEYHIFTKLNQFIMYAKLINAWFYFCYKYHVL